MAEALGELGGLRLVLVPWRRAEGVDIDRAQGVGVGEDIAAATAIYGW
ncbi:hypothetical protein GLX30_03385 [Streptomyces sp. Tu 2975]|nr:hypothetical protein GLX30_03385 [Streptomyces sp. Tu 2975]